MSSEATVEGGPIEVVFVFLLILKMVCFCGD